MFMCIYVEVKGWVWVPSLMWSIFFSEVRSLTEPGVHQFRSAGSPMSFCWSLVSCQRAGVTCIQSHLAFMWVRVTSLGHKHNLCLLITYSDDRGLFQPRVLFSQGIITSILILHFTVEFLNTPPPPKDRVFCVALAF